MSDIYCRKCGEPWDAWGARHGEMEPDEWRRFVRGEGCPCCAFGTICTACGGSGKERQERYGPECPVCMGRRVVRARRCRTAVSCGRGWYYGYKPNMHAVGDDEVRELLVREESGHECAEGWVEEATIRCPACWDEAPACATCGGTGALVAPTEDEATGATMGFLASLADATDGDEIWEAIEAIETAPV